MNRPAMTNDLHTEQGSSSLREDREREQITCIMAALDDFHVLAGRVTATHAKHVLDRLSALSSRPEGGFSASLRDTHRAPEAGVVGWQPTHRHIKSGGYYQVVGRGRDITNEHGEPGIEVVAYRGVGGHLWVRRAAEFDDGRFVKIEPNPPAEQGEGAVVVPVEPTREMWAAGADAVVGYKQRHHDKVVEQVWSAMIAARPQPVSKGEG